VKTKLIHPYYQPIPFLTHKKRPMNMLPQLSDWVSFLAYPNLFGIKGFVVVVVVVVICFLKERNFNIMILCNYTLGRWQAWENAFSSSFVNQIFRFFPSSFHCTKVKEASLQTKLLLYTNKLLCI
jgi:hypothetical protein